MALPSLLNTLGVTYESHRAWRSNNEAFKAWRHALEEAGLLVFQAAGESVAEMRGTSIHEHTLPAVVANRKDVYAGRIFSALHDVAHIMLRSGGLCDLGGATGISGRAQRGGLLQCRGWGDDHAPDIALE